MKNSVYVATLAILLISGNATAACSNGPGVARVNDPAALLAGKTVCAAIGGDRWQEFHTGTTSGLLIDYKRGPGHPVDPSGTVGSWSVSGSGGNTVVNHTYGSVTYPYSVFNNGNGTYSFCSANPEIVATVLTGQVACP